MYAPDREFHGIATRDRLAHMGDLPASWDINGRNLEQYRTVVVSLMTNLPHFLGWFVGDTDWAIGLVLGGHEWGGILHRNGTLTPDSADRLMAWWL